MAPSTQEQTPRNRLIVTGGVFLLLAAGCLLYTGFAWLMGWFPTPEPESGLGMALGKRAIFSAETTALLILPFALLGIFFVGCGVMARRSSVHGHVGQITTTKEDSAQGNYCLECSQPIPEDSNECPACGWSWQD